MDSRLGIALLTGTGGSLIGLLGVFLAFWFTSRHDRRQDQARREREAGAVSEKARADALRVLLTALWSSPLDLRWLPLQGAKALAAFADATIYFAFVTWPVAGPVAQWSLKQMNRVNHARSRFAHWAWLPLYRRHLRRAYANEITNMAAALFAWGQGALEVRWFEERLDPTPKVSLDQACRRGEQ